MSILRLTSDPFRATPPLLLLGSKRKQAALQFITAFNFTAILSTVIIYQFNPPIMKKLLGILCTGAAFLIGLSSAQAWSLEEAAKDYKGTEIKVIFLDRPGYRAAIEMLPEFEQKTGIKVSYELVPYENSREKEVLDFSAQGDLAIALVDLVWMGEFAESGWIVPVDEIKKKFPNLIDPDLDLQDFFPLLLDAFGTWNGVLYGLPFDNYSGLLYYNKDMLKAAGFDKPPETWDELINVYTP